MGAVTILLASSAALAEQAGVDAIGDPALRWSQPGLPAVSLQPGLPAVGLRSNESARWSVSAEALYWEVGDDADYAIGNPTADVIGSGDVEKVELGWEPGARVGVGAALPSGWEFAARGTWLSADESDSTSDTTNGAINPTQIHPFFASQIGDNDISYARGELDLDFYSIELEVAHRFEPTEDLHLRIFGGPHLARIDRDSTFSYTGFLNPADVTVVEKNLSMMGYGLRIGGDASWQGPAGISIYAGAAGSALYGDFKWENNEFEPATSDVNVDVDEDYTALVPVLQMRAGLGWQTAIDERVKIAVHAGWESQAWFGIDGRRFTDDVFRATSVRESRDISFQGLSAGLTVTF